MAVALRRWLSRPGFLPKALAAVCLAAPFVALLWVPLYAGATPRLFGAPFFYWYQALWVLLTPALLGVARALLGRRDEVAR